MRDLGTECARGSPPRPSDRRGASDCTQGPSLTAATLGLGPSRASRPRHFEWPHDVAGGLNLLWNQRVYSYPNALRASPRALGASATPLANPVLLLFFNSRSQVWLATNCTHCADAPSPLLGHRRDG